MDEIITEQLTIVYNSGCRAKDVSNSLPISWDRCCVSWHIHFSWSISL